MINASRCAGCLAGPKGGERSQTGEVRILIC